MELPLFKDHNAEALEELIDKKVSTSFIIHEDELLEGLKKIIPENGAEYDYRPHDDHIDNAGKIIAKGTNDENRKLTQFWLEVHKSGGQTLFSKLDDSKFQLTVTFE